MTSLFRSFLMLTLFWSAASLQAQKDRPLGGEQRPREALTLKPHEGLGKAGGTLSQSFGDAQTHVIFDLPPGWNLSKSDREVSTFRLDARTAPKSATMRAVANLASNPFPLSTFSGAFFYLSFTPRSKASACAAQTAAKPEKPLGAATIADLKFSRGLDEHGHICTEARDVTYTAMRHGSCLRFDLVVNTFCGGEVTGVQDMTPAELADVYQRMESILGTVRFAPR